MEVILPSAKSLSSKCVKNNGEKMGSKYATKLKF